MNFSDASPACRGLRRSNLVWRSAARCRRNPPVDEAGPCEAYDVGPCQRGRALPSLIADVRQKITTDPIWGHRFVWYEWAWHDLAMTLRVITLHSRGVTLWSAACHAFLRHDCAGRRRSTMGCDG